MPSGRRNTVSRMSLTAVTMTRTTLTNMMKRKTSCIISGSAAICLLTAVFLAERFSHPPDALAVSVRTADMRNLPQVTEISAETQKTAAAETTAFSEEKAPVRDLNLADAADLMRVDGRKGLEDFCREAGIDPETIKTIY